MKKQSAYKDVRILLTNPEEVRVGDRLQRNGDPITKVDPNDNVLVLSTLWSSVEVDAQKEIFVWRYVSSDTNS